MTRISIASVIALSLIAAARAGAQTSPTNVVWPDEGPRTWAPRPTAPEITPNDVRTRLYQFADDSMMGRRIGELGNYKGTAYIAAEFQRLGLKPAGDNGTYFQELPFGPVGFDVATSRLTVGRSRLAARTDWVPATPAAGIGGRADLANVATVFAGRWGDTTALDPAAFRGKVAVFLGGPGAPTRAAPMLRCDSVPDKFGAAAAIRVEAQTGTRGRGGPPPVRDTRAQAAGAAAMLFVFDSIPAAMRSTAFGARMAMQPTGPATGMPAAAITDAAAARIFRRPVGQLAQLTVGAGGQPVSGSWSYGWQMTKWAARNVIAVLPGSDPARANEYVLVSAHNDHVGTNPAGVDHDSLRAVNFVTRRQGANDPACRPTAEQQREIDSLIARARSIRPPRRDSIMNGADDDGSGTVLLLEIAERFVTERPARSIIFVSHQGEEAGLLGSRWFTDHPTIPLASIVAAHNMDMEGKGRVWQVKFGGPHSIQMLGSRRLSREFGDIIDSVNATRPDAMAIDRSWDVPANPLNRFCRSDQVYYVLHDVPVTYFSLGYALDYHQPTDEPQYIDYDHAARVGQFVHDIMLAIADRADRPAIAGPDPSYPMCR